jgi:hypothetical protein
MCIRLLGKVFTEPLPSNVRRETQQGDVINLLLSFQKKESTLKSNGGMQTAILSALCVLSISPVEYVDNTSIIPLASLQILSNSSVILLFEAI